MRGLRWGFEEVSGFLSFGGRRCRCLGRGNSFLFGHRLLLGFYVMRKVLNFVFVGVELFIIEKVSLFGAELHLIGGV